MDVQTWDAVFIRATRRHLHPVVADLAAWDRWWPGLSIAATDGVVALTLRPPGPLRPTRRWSAVLTRERPDLGIHLRYAGDVAGEAELYYLDEPAGTVVHYLLRGTVADRRWRPAVRDHRAGVRAALHALKDRFEGDREPGAEPDPALRAAQREAMAAFAARVAAGERRRAATRAGT